ncbi:3-hydroxybutyrate dehydrogenase [Lentilitoribacter sp. Alg239-R112]|uniref:3-hydroxybutyrate dehydrogenase n=1 Tax=Lentilitoribacter sp. Alg239-R112 TaxID=2305987 RepID=UPI0013A6CDCA|nr:3-hydroxybutyrate dehydrogenase [Lentilitoribacter sp. Alg239-R112]
MTKTAIITGSTSGIGLGIAKAFAKAGMNVVINGLGSAEDNEPARAEVNALGSGKTAFHGANMMQPEQIKDLVQSTEDKFGQVDIIVNNAGIQFVEKVEDFPTSKWDAIIAINMSSAFHTTRVAFGGMKERGFGRIINVGSVHSLIASPYKSAYVTAKHGILGLTKTLALEGAEHGVTANAVCPGYVETPLVTGQIADTAKARGMSEEEVIKNVILKAQATKQFVQIDQVAALALYLTSDDAAQITGTALPVDGGWSAQ